MTVGANIRDMEQKKPRKFYLSLLLFYSRHGKSLFALGVGSGLTHLGSYSFYTSLKCVFLGFVLNCKND